MTVAVPSKLPLWRTIGQAYAVWETKFPDLVRACWLWMLLMAPVLAIWTIWETFTGPNPPLAMVTQIVDEVVMLPALASVAVAWHRLLLRDEDSGPGVYLRLDRIVAGYAILAFWIGVITLSPICVYEMFQIVTGTRAARPDMATLIALLLALIALLIAARLSLALPGIALGRDDVTLRTAWRVSKGNTWRMFWAYFFCIVPWVTILTFASISVILVAPSRTTSALLLLVQDLLSIPLGMISVGVLSFAYRHFFERRADIGQQGRHRMRILLILLISLISSAVVAVAATLFVAYRANEAVALYNRGNAYAAKAQYDRAIEDFDQAIRLDPKYALTLYDRGIAYGAKGQYDRAIEDFDQAIGLDPKYALAFDGRGVAYAKKAQYDRAIEDFDQAIALDPKYALAFYSRGVAYAAKAQYDRAIEDFDQAIALDPKDAPAIYSRGIVYFNKGQFAVAARDFEQSLSINAAQAYGVLWLHLARARSDRGDTEELTGNAVKLDLKTWPGPVVAFYLKGIDANGVMAAARSGDAKTQREQGCQVSFYVGEDAVLRQDTAEATRLLRQARETCPPDFAEFIAAQAELKRLEK
jgi:lipoprotein NlpI